VFVAAGNSDCHVDSVQSRQHLIGVLGQCQPPSLKVPPRQEPRSGSRYDEDYYPSIGHADALTSSYTDGRC